MARLRQGRANTGRGAAHFLRETVSRVRHAGGEGQLTLRADSGFYSRHILAMCRDKGVRFSITVRQHRHLRNLIEEIPETDSRAHTLLDGWSRRRGRNHLHSLCEQTRRRARAAHRP